MPSDGLLFLSLYIFRLANALLCRTFFQPDEFWQSLEVAHRWVEDYGFLTWEWRTENALRSPFVPLFYTPAFLLAKRWDADGSLGYRLLFPRFIQALFASLTDLYTFKLGRRLLGPHRADEVLKASVLSFMSAVILIRPFSNSIETALTAIALAKWPWDGRNTASSLPACFALAALASVIRPPSVIMWILLAVSQLVQTRRGDRFRLFWAMFTQFLPISIGAGFYSFALDSYFYNRKTWSPLNFLRVNVVNNISAFYGRNDWSYYIVQGLPALAWIFLPQLWRGMQVKAANELERKALRSLQVVMIGSIFAYSCLGHKEIRFVMPLLPIVNVFIGRGLATRRTKTFSWILRALMVVLPAAYLLLWHMRGQVDIMLKLREILPAHLHSIGFLMPCHSTPWQSHLGMRHLERGPGERLWFLTCEPPLGIHNASSYQDQSDVFYADPLAYLQTRFPSTVDLTFPASQDVKAPDWQHTWPSHLVMFEALLAKHPRVGTLLREQGYRERLRVWNSHVHEDARRVGDIVVFEAAPLVARQVDT